MAQEFDSKKLEAALRQATKLVPDGDLASLRLQLGAKQSESLCRTLRKATNTLHKLADELDAVRPPSGQIELFAPATIGRLIGQELTSVAPQPLDSLGSFYGSGVYALYYSGAFPAYTAIANTKVPIYVGMAKPKHRHAKSPREQGQNLQGRLSDHRKSIRLANTSISIGDFQFRYLATESGWQGTAEEFLIWLYQPVWNKEIKVCSGFGKHGDKARTELSAWDMLHGGRKWAAHQKSRRERSPESVAQAIQDHYAKLLHDNPAFWSTRFNPRWVNARARQTSP